jgi:chromosome segregation ATPase
LNAVNRQWEDVTEQRNTVTEQLTIVSDQRDQVTNAKIELEQRLDHLQAKFDSNRRQFDEQIEQLQSDIEHRQQVIDTQNSELARLSALLSAQTSTSTDADARIAEAIAARDQLVTLVQQKHDESVRYHAQLQQAIVDREAIEQRMNHISRDMQSRYEEEKRIITDRLHNADEECARANRELDRLRQHLLQMEENYTRDAGMCG